MVQHVDRIDPEFKLFAFRNPHPLDQVRVKPQNRWPLEPVVFKNSKYTISPISVMRVRDGELL